jgi:spore maturation protein CgeB
VGSPVRAVAALFGQPQRAHPEFLRAAPELAPPRGRDPLPDARLQVRTVLVVYTSWPPIAEYLKAAFARRGVEARTFHSEQNNWFDRFIIRRINKLAHNFRIIPKSRNFFEHHPLSHMNYRSRRLREEIAAYDPDLVFHVRGLGFRRWAFDGARLKFAWWVESDERVAEALAEAPWFDHFFLINSSSVEAARRAGFGHAEYLPHAVDADAFRPVEGVRRDLDFCFVGRWTEERQRFIEAALEVSPNGAVYGPKWRRKTWRDPRLRRIVEGRHIAGEALVRLYNRAKVVFNITAWGADGGANRSGMTMRLFEVPATGSFLLTDQSAEMKLAVTPGVHVETFSGLEEFREKLRFYLRSDEARERIARQGMTHVRAEHSYDRTVDAILAACGRIEARGK